MSLLDQNLNLIDEHEYIIVNSLTKYICHKNPIYTIIFKPEDISINTIIINNKYKYYIRCFNIDEYKDDMLIYITNNANNLVTYYKIGNVNGRLKIIIYLDNERDDYKHDPCLCGGQYTLNEILEEKYKYEFT